MPGPVPLTRSAPLRPIEPDFAEVLLAALDQRQGAREFVRASMDAGIHSILFIGTGGSLASSVQAVDLLKARLTDLYVDNLSSAEVLANPPARLNAGSLVIASSHSGGTPETVAATNLAKELGATVISLSSTDEGPLPQLADFVLTYGSDRTITSPKQILLAHVTWAVLDSQDAAPELAEVDRAYDALPGALPSALVEADDELAEAAATLLESGYVYVLSSGPNLGGGYLFSMCYLMEMQWIRSAAFDAGEFFHGAFELVVDDAAVVVLAGEDSTRPLVERAHRFAETHSTRTVLIDTLGLTLPGVPAHLRGFITPIVLGVLVFRLADQLESISGHSLDDRRYMNRVEY